MLHRRKKLDYLCNCKSEVGSVCKWNLYPKSAIKGQKKIKIQSYESRGKSYPDIKQIHIMLTDSLRSIIGVNNN